MLRCEIEIRSFWNHVKYLTWYDYGRYHRIDGPAMVDDLGNLIYLQYGAYHRSDGPAMINSNKQQYFYLRDEEVTSVDI